MGHILKVFKVLFSYLQGKGIIFTNLPFSGTIVFLFQMSERICP